MDLCARCTGHVANAEREASKESVETAWKHGSEAAKPKRAPRV